MKHEAEQGCFHTSYFIPHTYPVGVVQRLNLSVLGGYKGARSAISHFFGGVLAHAHQVGTALFVAIGLGDPQAAFGVPDEREAAAAVLRSARGGVDIADPDGGVGPDLRG